jgi:hypothetical protein
MAEKQGFHVFPSPAQMITTIVALPLAVAKGLEAAPERRSEKARFSNSVSSRSVFPLGAIARVFARGFYAGMRTFISVMPWIRFE